jgi:phospho-N-acetylmuramoyl-pentapeptide-transferase
MLGEIVMGGSASLLICMFLGPRFIEFLRVKEFGQQIREEGPAGHHGKAGTPTMGGLVIFIAIAVPFLILSEYRWGSLAVLGTAIAMAALGFVDDIIKLRRRRSLGVSGRTKLLVQALAAIGLWIIVKEKVGLTDSLDLQVVDASVKLGVAYPVLILLVLAGATNGVNLTDGLDGLATGASTMVFGAYTLVNIWQNNQWCGQTGLDQPALCYEVRDPLDLAIIASAITGACFGFLWWNASPASIFMGDTGSLALGGALAGFAILSRTELLLLVLGGLFVMVTLSVMIQVGVFKASRASGLFRSVFRVEAGHRVFRIAPIHHHFEMLGWEQVNVVIRFWIITGLSVAAGLGVFYAEWVAGT